MDATNKIFSTTMGPVLDIKNLIFFCGDSEFAGDGDFFCLTMGAFFFLELKLEAEKNHQKCYSHPVNCWMKRGSCEGDRRCQTGNPRIWHV